MGLWPPRLKRIPDWEEGIQESRGLDTVAMVKVGGREREMGGSDQAEKEQRLS